MKKGGHRVDNEQQRSRISVINEDILCDKNLNPAEKMVYARICFFEEFFESAEATAEYLGISKWAVQHAKRKLEELGYIICVENTGRGKKYVADLNAMVRNRKLRVGEKQTQTLVIPNSELGNTKLRVGKSQHIDKNIGKTIGKKENNIGIGRDFWEVLDEKEVRGDLRQTFVEFIKFRKATGKKFTPYALKLAITNVKKLSDNEQEQIEILNQSIMNGWSGLFPLNRSNTTRAVSTDALYQPKDGDDITYKRMFEKWKKYLGTSLKETVSEVAACRELLDDLGEDGLERLIVALRMRSEESFLTRELKNIKDFVGLNENKLVVQSFYDKNWKVWKMKQEAASSGKKPWEL